MAYSIDRKDGRQILILEGEVTIRHAQELAARLSQDLDFGDAVVINTSQLEDIDTCVLQLVCSLSKTIEGVSFGNPSQIFLAAVDRCSLRREFPGLREAL